jgi:hypothetical protein
MSLDVKSKECQCVDNFGWLTVCWRFLFLGFISRSGMQMHDEAVLLFRVLLVIFLKFSGDRPHLISSFISVESVR